MRRNEIMATAATPAHWQPIGEIVAEFRTECSDFEHLVQSLFDQLDQLRSELERKGRELEKERQRVAERERQLSEQRKETSRIAHQFEHQEAKLSEALAELDELKSLVRRQTEDAGSSQWEKQLEAALRERQALQRQLADAQSELAKHTSLARDLAGARKEIGELRAQIAAGEGGAAILRSDDAERVSQLEQERAALEAELELVRGRAAELYDVLGQERRSLAEHRAETAAELKQLRRLVEQQADVLAHHASQPLAASSEPACEIAVDDIDDEPMDANSSDPVINSVMAQFAKLQKEVAERRKHRKPK